MKGGIMITGFVLLIVLMVVATAQAIDKQIANQDRMLCESAKKSGNQEYLSKCACYYQGQGIECLKNNK